MGGTYQKHTYSVDLNYITERLKEIVQTQELNSKLKISKQEYLERVNYGASYLRKKMGYNNEPHFIIEFPHPGFDYWFGYLLCLIDPYKIPLVLDHH